LGKCQAFWSHMQNNQKKDESGGRATVLPLKKACKSARKRIEKKRKKQEKEYEESRKWLWYKQIGDSLLAEASTIKKGTTERDIFNVHRQCMETIKMNPKLDAVRNAELFYKKAKKGKRGEEACAAQISTTEKELSFIESMIVECDACLQLEETAEEFTQRCNDIREKLQASKLIPGMSNSQTAEKDMPRVPYRHFTIEGWNVYVGKNNTQNDELSIKFAKPWDVWCHVAAHAGSHVVLKREKNAAWPPKHIIEKVAALAVWFSKAKHTSYAEVHITEARYVHKRRKSPPGEVLLDTYKTVRVAPQSPQEMFKNK